MINQNNTPDAKASAFYWLGRLFARVSIMMRHEDELKGEDQRSIVGIRQLSRPADYHTHLMGTARCCLRNFDLFGRNELHNKCKAAIAEIDAQIAQGALPEQYRRNYKKPSQEVADFTQGEEREYLVMVAEGVDLAEEPALAGG